MRVKGKLVATETQLPVWWAGGKAAWSSLPGPGQKHLRKLPGCKCILQSLLNRAKHRMWAGVREFKQSVWLDEVWKAVPKHAVFFQTPMFCTCWSLCWDYLLCLSITTSVKSSLTRTYRLNHPTLFLHQTCKYFIITPKVITLFLDLLLCVCSIKFTTISFQA